MPFLLVKVFFPLILLQIRQVPVKFIGNGVVAIASPRIATQDSPTGQIEALQRTMLLDGLNGVG